MTTTPSEDEPQPLPGGLVGAINRAFFGTPATGPAWDFPLGPIREGTLPMEIVEGKSRPERLVDLASAAIQVTARLCIVVTILTITLALCARLLAWAL